MTKKQKNCKPSRRNSELAMIHIAKKDLGLNDEVYRNILESVAGVRSAADLDEISRRIIIEHFKELGFNPHRKGYRSHHRSAKRSGMHVPASADRSGLLSKIGALLTVMGLPWSYADGIANRMFGIAFVRWLYPDQLRKVIASLMYRKKRIKGNSQKEVNRK
ncbi:MAG: regulatory protein GemA [Deltaproteobacteria bacterium]|nr:regulatory protein GemA [Deltaproteobacteria bacterium]